MHYDLTQKTLRLSGNNFGNNFLVRGHNKNDNKDYLATIVAMISWSGDIINTTMKAMAMISWSEDVKI